jgi:hypothetical protein
MTFFSRPNLDDIQFKQTQKSSLSLSGQTRFRTWSGLTLSDGAGGDIVVTASGASSATTEGYVLTYMNGLISLQPSSSSGGTFQFNTHRETTRSGIPNVCVGGTCTVNNFLEGYFFPAVDPQATLSITSGGSNREFGDDGVGNLSYCGIRQTNKICLIAIDTDANGTYDEFPVSSPINGDSGGTFSYTYALSCAAPPTGTTQTSVSFNNCVEDVCGECDIANASITWRNRIFGLKSTTLYTDSSITAASGSSFINELGINKSRSINNENFSNQFFYYLYPSSFGTPTFTVNGLPNNAWGNQTTGTLFKIDYTNTYGYTNQYYVARSDSRITGTYNINIS